jgi:hypothetical protein
MGFRKLSNGVMRILTDQLNAHILKIAQAREVPIAAPYPRHSGNSTTITPASNTGFEA